MSDSSRRIGAHILGFIREPTVFGSWLAQRIFNGILPGAFDFDAPGSRSFLLCSSGGH